MSRSNYSDDCENLELWRGNVERTIKGKRGQALLKELEAALLALPERALCANDVANPEDGTVCALGAVALKRKLEKGAVLPEALKRIAEEFPEGCEAEELADAFKISSMLAREITYINDEDGRYDEKPQDRYERVLKWVKSQIKVEA